MSELRTTDRLLGFGGPAAWGLFGVYAVTVLILAVSGGAPSHSPAGIAATVAVLVAGFIGVFPGSYPMPTSRAVAIVGLVTVCNLGITFQLSALSWPGWASWNFGMTAIALFTLALRGRIAWSWIGLGLMTTIAAGWSWIGSGSPMLGIQLVYLHLGVNLAVSLFAVGMRRAVRRIEALTAVEAQRVAQLATQEAGAAEHDAEVRFVLEQVGEVLGDIAGGRSGGDVARYRVLEARLRDRIRARRIDEPAFRRAVDRARERNVDVVVLDDAVDTEAPGLDDALAALAPTIDEVDAGTVTVRLAGAPLRLTLAADGRRVQHELGGKRPEPERASR